MMLPAKFAAKRLDRFKEADDELRELVRAALSAWDGKGEFNSAALEEAVEVIWLEHFAAEAPRADYERFLPRFREVLTNSLSQTSAPDADGPSEVQIERVTTFLGTLAVNDGTMRGAGARGIRFKRWTTMHDPSVRHAHSVADGQTRPIGDPFDVEGVELQYPGQPIGSPEIWINCRCVVQPAAARGDANVSDTTMTLSDDFDSRSASLTAAGDVDEPHTGVGVFLIPAENDPIVAASSEDQAHMTTIWMGTVDDLNVDTAEFPMIDIDTLMQEVRQYAAELTPITVPVSERGQGELGDEGAIVVFLEPTEAVLALRDGFLLEENVRSAYDRVEQYPDWTPHVTLGYPETPPAGEYDGDAVTFDRVGLWIGPDRYEYPMGESMAGKELSAARETLASLVAAGEIDPNVDKIDPETDKIDPEVDEMPVDELEEGEDLITEIPVHGVATLEGVATGDGRGFRPDALSIGPLPQPLGYEYVSGHGSDTSHVAVVGRIDEYFKVPAPQHGEGAVEVRWRGVIMPGKEYGAQAIESIVDGSYTGLSVIVDSVTVDVQDERERVRQQFIAERDRSLALDEAASDEEAKSKPLDDAEIEALVDEWVGDGTQPTTWFSKAQIRRFDMVPTGAFQQGYTALGHEFADELTPEQVTASAAALEDCGCGVTLLASATGGATMVVDLTVLTEEELAEYDMLSIDEQEVFARERGAIVAAAGFAPGTKDGPGWITNPIATSRIRRYWTKGKGAAKIAWGTPGDFNRCRKQLAKYVQKPEWLAGLCANMHYEVLGVWPGQEGGGRGHSLAASAEKRTPAPIAVMASASTDVSGGAIYPASAFLEPTDDYAYAMRIDRKTRTISGYAAAWGSCHIGIAGTCEEAPRSSTDYAFFRKGTVDTDQGEQRVALITYGIGHASEYASAASATAHYDQTDAVRAYINIGENHLGIWYSGVLAPWVTDADIDAMRAIGRVSGDWRSQTGYKADLEMVGLVVVNTEGFQLAASAAIGIGALPKDDGILSAKVEVLEGMTALSADDIAGIAIAAAERVYDLQRRQEIIERAAPARAALRAHLLAAARAELATMEV